MPVPACPAWTVTDVFSHLSGLCQEVVDGVLEGRPNDHDTARQVANRKGKTIGEICDEWENNAPALDAILSGPAGEQLALLSMDAWNHDQDVRHALNLPPAREDVTTTTAVGLIAGFIEARWQEREQSPSLRLTTPSGSWLFGVGEPLATLETSDFELCRVLVGRRTHPQMRALKWTGDPGELLPRLHVFGPPAEDLVE